MKVRSALFFGDLNLDQVVENITTDRKEYNLASIYYNHLQNIHAIAYRQEIMQDLGDTALMEAIKLFSRWMRGMRERLDQAKNPNPYRYAMERRFKGAIEIYCEATRRLAQDLAALDIRSRGLRLFRDYATQYAASVPFRNLVAETTKLKYDLSAIRYGVVIKEDGVTICPLHEEGDYSVEIEKTFEKLIRETTNPYRLEIPGRQGINHIEAQIWERVVLMLPDTFRTLDTFFAEHAGFVDERISRFDRAVQFFVSYLAYIEKFRRAGLEFCRPQLSQTSR